MIYGRTEQDGGESTYTYFMMDNKYFVILFIIINYCNLFT